MKLTAEYTILDLLKLAKADLEAAGYTTVDPDDDGDSGSVNKTVFTFIVAPIEKVAPPQIQEVTTPEEVKPRSKKLASEMTEEERRKKYESNRRWYEKKKARQNESTPQEESNVLLEAAEVVAATATPF